MVVINSGRKRSLSAKASAHVGNATHAIELRRRPDDVSIETP